MQAILDFLDADMSTPPPLKLQNHAYTLSAECLQYPDTNYGVVHATEHILSTRQAIRAMNPTTSVQPTFQAMPVVAGSPDPPSFMPEFPWLDDCQLFCV